jgi:protease IV
MLKFWFRLVVAALAIAGLFSLGRSAFRSWSGGLDRTAVISKHSILVLELHGVILNGKQFLENLKDYREDSKIKAIFINVNSPGGAVGPSQEIYAELKKTKEEFKKPIVCFTSGLMASGGYYVSLGCDQIVVAPGALVGSIGVIMSFANLEKLYDWAKVSRYSITSGKFKDSGAEYRSMRSDEKQLFQDMIDEVYQQFKATVKEGRPKMKQDVLDEYTDGRVFTGAKAVQLGFADSVGTEDDALKLTAEMAGLKEGHYDLFEIPRKKKSIWDLGEEEQQDTINGLVSGNSKSSLLVDQIINKTFKKVLGAELLNQPVLLMPGVWF